MKPKNGDFVSHKDKTPLLAQRLICVEQRSINLAILPKALVSKKKFTNNLVIKYETSAREPFTRNVDVSFWERVILRKAVNDIQSIIRLFFNVHHFPKCNTIGSIYLFQCFVMRKIPLVAMRNCSVPFSRNTDTIILYITCAVMWLSIEW